MLGGVHGNLEASGKCLKVTSLADITVLQSRSHGVHIKEGVFSVLDFGDGLAVHRLMSGVADSSQMVVGSFVLSLNSLESIQSWLEN
jgi:hypothetical protein